MKNYRLIKTVLSLLCVSIVPLIFSVSTYGKDFSGHGFLAGGDSGSLMVEDVSTKPRAVGLLFAGSSSLAVANPIDEVLSYFGATMVGN